MFDYKTYALNKLASLAPKYLPFADVATDDVSLSQLLRLSLFQITVGMALVMLVGTLNRVMIVELNVPATLVAGMLAIPLVFAPFRTFIGYKSDTHVSALGLRRIPYIWKGTLYQFGGFAIMPFALLVLSGYGEAIDAPRWIGLSSAALAFLLVGAGVHTVQTVGLALATDLVREEDHPKVVGLMYVMLLLGMVVSALVYGALLEPYSPGVLIRVIQGTAVVTVALNMLAMWKQEVRSRERARQMETTRPPQFSKAWSRLMERPGMLLEPYGGQALGFTVAETTRLTALLATGTLVGFAVASRVLSTSDTALPLGRLGAAIGIPGFLAIILSSAVAGAPLFLLGTLATGVGAGLFGHATLTATIRAAPPSQVGMSLGAWGAVQATCAGLGVALAGVVRDVLVGLPAEGGLSPAAPYNVVFMIEIAFLILAVLWAAPRFAPRIPAHAKQSANSLEVS